MRTFMTFILVSVLSATAFAGKEGKQQTIVRPPSSKAIRVKGLVSFSKDGSTYLLTKSRGTLEIVAESPTVKMVVKGIEATTNEQGRQPTLFGVLKGRLGTTTGVQGTRPAIYAKDFNVYTEDQE